MGVRAVGGGRWTPGSPYSVIRAWTATYYCCYYLLLTIRSTTATTANYPVKSQLRLSARGQ
mgnify:CR=1 FL=1